MSIRGHNYAVGEQNGYIPLPLHSWRLQNAGATDYGLVAATAAIGSGGVGGIDGSPKLIRVNAATDAAAVLSWASSTSLLVMNNFQLPLDYNPVFGFTFKMTANLGAGAGATTDFAMVYTIGAWVQGATGAYVLSVDGGGATQSFATAYAAAQPVIAQATGAGAIVQLSRIIADPSTAVKALAAQAGSTVSVTLAAGTHTTDASNVFATWVEYTRK